MLTWQKLADDLKTDSVLDNLTDAQAESIIYVLSVTLHIDNRVAFMEKIEFDDLLLEIPWSPDKQAKVETFLKLAHEKVQTANDDEIKTIFKTASQHITDPAIREKVYTMSAILAWSDAELHHTESQGLIWLAQAFEMDSARAKEILDQVLAG